MCDCKHISACARACLCSRDCVCVSLRVRVSTCARDFVCTCITFSVQVDMLECEFVGVRVRSHLCECVHMGMQKK